MLKHTPIRLLKSVGGKVGVPFQAELLIGGIIWTLV